MRTLLCLVTAIFNETFLIYANSLLLFKPMMKELQSAFGSQYLLSVAVAVNQTIIDLGIFIIQIISILKLIWSLFELK